MPILKRGENRVWAAPTVGVRVSGARSAALVLGAGRRPLGDDPWVRDATPGCPWLAQQDGMTTVDLVRAPAEVDRVVVIAWDYPAVPATELVGPAEILSLDSVRLAGERALILVEVYRSSSAWKVRHVGQGYAGGLLELSRHLDAPLLADEVGAATVEPPVPDPVQHLGMILDDAARATAAAESTYGYARARLEEEAAAVLDDPRRRLDPDAGRVRAAAQERHDAMVAEARNRQIKDLEHLARELVRVESGLPRPLAAWTSPAWQGLTPIADVVAVRVGELSPLSAPEFRVPLVRTLPLQPSVWLDTSDAGEQMTMRLLRALVVRLCLATPPNTPVAVVDVGGRLGLGTFAPGVQVATDAAAAARLLDELVQHTGVVEMAQQARRLDDLPPEHRPGRVLVVHDAPTGLSATAVDQLRQLATLGPFVGLSVALSGELSGVAQPGSAPDLGATVSACRPPEASYSMRRPGSHGPSTPTRGLSSPSSRQA